MSSSSESNLNFTCPGCKKTIRYPPSKAGLSGKCPNCQTRITLPALSAKPQIPSAPTTYAATQKPTTAVTPASLTVAASTKVNQKPPVDPPAVPQVNQEVMRFADEGQNVSMVAKLLERVKEICTSTEEILYMAIQQKPVANFSPDAIVLTNRRALVFRQKMLGQMEFTDFLWANVNDVHIKEAFLGATITITSKDRATAAVDYLPKSQARKVYRHGQEMEEKMIEWRRQRQMEEMRSAADQVVINSNVPQASQPADDPVARLSKLKQMLDAGLIAQAEFDEAKAKILGSI